MPTVNDPLHPERIREGLEELRDLVTSIAGREAALNREHAAALLAAKRNSTARKESDAAAHAAAKAALMADCDAAESGARRRYDERRNRIAQAVRKAHADLADRVRGAKDRELAGRQVESLRAKQDARDTWERARQDHREFVQTLAADHDEIGSLARGALKSLRGFRPIFGGMLRKGRWAAAAVPGAGRTRESLRDETRERIAEAREALGPLRRNPLAALFRWVPLSLMLAFVAGWFAWRTYGAEDRAAAMGEWGATILPALLAPLVLHLAATAMLWSPVRRMARSLQSARVSADAAANVSEAKVTALAESLKADLARRSEDLSVTLRGSDELGRDLMEEGRAKIEAQAARLPGKAEALHRRALTRIARRLEDGFARLDGAATRAESEREEEHNAGIAAADKHRREEIEKLRIEWDERVGPLHRELAASVGMAAGRFPAWSEEWLASWSPPAAPGRVLPFGSIRVSLPELAGGMPESGRFKLDSPVDFEVPRTLGFPDRASLLVEGDAAAAARAFNEIVLRVLATHPAGRAAFTIIDPVGLGRDFAGLMHLGDYEESLIHGRIWTQSAHIEERLAEIAAHIEKVIQMYLRNEFATLDEYNERAGTVAEKRRFVIVSGFPAGFSDTAAKRLLGIAASGARCGVHLLIHRDPRQPVDPALLEALDAACMKLVPGGDGFLSADFPAGARATTVFPSPEASLESALVHRFGRASVDSNRVEVPFSRIAPQDGDWWTSSTEEELRVPIGRSGATKSQLLALGKGTRQHVLVAGKTGSGKSTLFHVMICNLALHCSPDEVEFYLVDFKKGVEFKCYGAKGLPHARVVAVESDRDFGLSVLHRVDDELRVRGELFRKHGVQDIAGYRKATGLPLPRTLLIIDEFQEFFTEDDAVAQSASLLLDRIVRQGRAFGIHVILGSQTLGGAYTLARATLGQMVVRIALQCNEADAHLIMDDDNPAPRLLTRPGEGIYNDNAGAVAANSPFQTVWLSEEERNGWLDRIAAMAADRYGKPAVPVVFEGNAPADLAGNAELAALLDDPSPSAGLRAWLGEPNAIKGPTEAAFERRAGSHLLVVGQSEDRIANLMEIAALSLAAGRSPDGARFMVIDSGSLAKRLAGMLPQEVRSAAPGAADAVFEELAAELEGRSAGGGDFPEIFVFIPALHRCRKLKQEEDFLFSMDDGAKADPAKVFADLAASGAPAGIHLLVGVDTWNNVSRWLPRKVMAEFGMRVLFQMSAADSANLIDSPAAGSLGLHRALLHRDDLGTLEIFRPYAEPGAGWMQDCRERLKKRAAAGAVGD